MLHFKDYIVVQESSLQRLKQHIDNHEPILFITGSRNENTPAQNKANLWALKRYFNISGFGYNEVTGYYPEEGKDVVEKSLIVYTSQDKEDELLNIGISLGKKMEQSSILFIDTDGNAFYVSTRPDSWVGSVGSKMKLGKFTKLDNNTIEKAFTKINGKKFKFDSVSEDICEKPRQYNEYIIREQFLKVLEEYKDNCIQQWEQVVL